MLYLNLKTSHKPVRNYYKALKEVQQLSLLHEGAVAPQFANLLRACASRMSWTLAEQHQIPRKGRRPLRADGVFLDQFKLRHGVWEAKDSQDDLDKEVKKKFREGYPQDNILFQAPERAILVQNGRIIADDDITDPNNLVAILKLFCEYQPQEFEQWDIAVEEFKERVPELSQSLLALIETERKQNKRFRDALVSFKTLMRDAINPNLSDNAVEEMLIQHLLTERIFRKVFNNPDFAQRNIIAREIEKVIDALTSRHFSRTDFLQNLDRFYGAIEATAATIEEYSEKQDFLNTVYEKFFQGFSVKVADTHGIVYTPQPIVDFMVRSVDDILKREFGKADGLASDGVAVLDPFVGTGNFLLRVMRQMPKSKLPHKYAHDLFCNEVMLLPYYIASMNLEHEFYELTGRYQPFEGISLVDTFELAEGRQMPLFAPENTQRVQRQKNTPIFVIIGNPPYNAFQVDENDNNRNRKYPAIEEHIYETYATDSTATLVNQLGDPYVKAIRWASDRIGNEGIVSFITNNSFIEDKPFDGMRKHLAKDFNKIYILDLKGNIRKDSMRDGIPLGEKHTVFGLAAMVGISIVFFIKNSKEHNIYYNSVPFRSTRQEKFDFLEMAGSATEVKWQEIHPDKKHNWLTEGLQNDFDEFLPLGDKVNKRKANVKALFQTFSNGIKSNNDAYVFNFNEETLSLVAEEMVEDYATQRDRWIRMGEPKALANVLRVNEQILKWIRNTKKSLLRGLEVSFVEGKVRRAQYRPYSQKFYYFEKIFNEDIYQIPQYFPNDIAEAENRLICVTNHSQIPFVVQMSNLIPCLDVGGRPTQCFPFYTYTAAPQVTGTSKVPVTSDSPTHTRRENITDWALAQFRTTYAAAPRPQGFSKPLGSPLDKWDIFHYIYSLLHHPSYRDTYAANLRRELPRIPFVQPQHFWRFVEAGRRLADIHVNYESQPKHSLTAIENPDEPLNYRVEKMRLSRDKTELKYNEFLTLTGIPPQVFKYKLGNRSALDWIINQYRVKTDKRSGIVNDPNNLDDETYILRLIKQVITVSLETVDIVNSLPPLEIIEDED